MKNRFPLTHQHWISTAEITLLPCHSLNQLCSVNLWEAFCQSTIYCFQVYAHLMC